VNGASNEQISRLLFLALPVLEPELVMINLTWPGRREYVAASGEFFNFIPKHRPEWNPVLSECWDHFNALVSAPNDRLNLFRNYSAMAALLRDRPWNVSACTPRTLEGLEEHLSKDHFAGFLHPDGRTNDYARDHLHPGRSHHRQLAEACYARLEGLGFVRETLARVKNQGS
jgi:hypothetical protein